MYIRPTCVGARPDTDNDITTAVERMLDVLTRLDAALDTLTTVPDGVEKSVAASCERWTSALIPRDTDRTRVNPTRQGARG